jgi:hypothetical protein
MHIAVTGNVLDRRRGGAASTGTTRRIEPLLTVGPFRTAFTAAVEEKALGLSLRNEPNRIMVSFWALDKGRNEIL